MRKLIISGFIISLIFVPFATNAGCCGCDPVYEYSKIMEVKSAVWVRDEACVATGAIIDTLQAGEVVQVTHKTDGWYKVISPRGKVGWSGEQFLQITSKSLTNSNPGTCSTCNNNPVPDPEPITDPSYSSSSLSHTKGYILLQVQENGEAWYVNPENFKRYYMKDGPTAYEMMRTFGLGITDADLAKIPSVANTAEMNNSSSICSYNSLANKLKGKILLQVQQNGEAWYVYPKTCRMIYMKDGAAAYEIMRFLGLGITNSDLSKLSADELDIIPYNNTSTNTDNNNDPVVLDGSIPVDQSTGAKFVSDGSLIAGDGSFQKGSVPSGFNYAIINQYVLDRINKERTQRGMPAIVSDQRMVDTASVWAEQMYLQGAMTHTRQPVNMMAREWVWQNFTVAFSEDWGWLYENIGGGNYNRSQGINESIMASMDSLFDFYMSEESYNGIHYQTIMHDHLTHVGVGLYFEGGPDSGKLWTVLHYGALFSQVPVIDKTW